MVGVLVFLPWYLNKIHLEVAYSILHLLKVLLHPFILAFIVAINLTGHYLRVTIHDHICSSCHFGEIQSCYQSFILYLIIGCREINTNHDSTLSPFGLWNTTLALLACLLEDPFMWMLHCRLSSAPWPSIRVNSMMKSAITYSFIVVHGRYYM